MPLPFRAALLSLTLCLTGCATIMDGTSQELTVKTDPIAAHCAVYREGVRLGDVPSTPGVVKISKSGKDIAIACVKKGYKLSALRDVSGIDSAAVGNIVFGLIGGPIGVVVDAASGANNEYVTPISIALLPTEAGAPDVDLPATMPTPKSPVVKQPTYKDATQP